MLNSIFIRKSLSGAIILILSFTVSALAESNQLQVSLQNNDYFDITNVQTAIGEDLVRVIIHGPPEPPPGYELERMQVPLPEGHEVAAIKILPDVPAFNWSFGCTATSAAMIAGYYDRTGWGNIYVGPTNNGVTPLTNSVWPDWIDGSGAVWHQCPLSATHLGLDGRTDRGHVDDYWISYGQPGPDPWNGNWTEHVHGDCTADYLSTNQWVNPAEEWNIDGGTVIYSFNNGSILECQVLEGYGWPYSLAGDVGFKRFFEARGYTVSTCYTQRTDNNAAGGFSFADYMAEIDAGRPVMFHVTGHTMVGIGYDDSTSTIYFHDTWDYDTHAMTWGGSYYGMTQWSVSIIHVDPISGDVNGDGSVTLIDLIVSLRVAACYSDGEINEHADVNGDGHIGIPEALYILKEL